MAGAILLPRQHRNQPLYPAAIDQNNPLTRGIWFLLLPVAGKFDQLSGNALISGGTNKTIGPGGMAWSNPSLGNGDRYYPDINGNTQYTVGAVVLDKQSGAYRNPFDGDDISNKRVFQLRLNVSSQAEFIGFNTSSSASTATSGSVSSGAPVVLVGGVDAAQKPFVYATNTAAGSGTALTGTVQGLSKTSRLFVGETNAGQAQLFTGDVYLAVYWDRALSPDEIGSFIRNPWQIFSTPDEAIWISSAAGAVLAGASTSTTTTTGALTTEIAMAGAASGVASANGGLTTSIAVTGASLSVATASGGLSTAISLIGGASSVTLVNGSLTTTIALSGASLAQAAAAAGLTSVIALAGQSQASATTSGSLTAGGGISGAAASQTTATGDLTVQITLSGLASASVLAAGSLTTSIAAAGAASAQVTASGDLTISTTLSGAALAQAIATGSLTTTIALTGSAVGQVVASGDLSLLGSLVADPRYVLKHTARDFTLWHTARDFRI